MSMAARIALEEEMRSNDLGRRSFELRLQARRANAEGRASEAFTLYEEAAALHAAEDTSAAAAMCWFDLGQVYTKRREGVRAANLAAAEELFRRALACPPVSKDLHRMAEIHDALGSCLRHRAHARLDGLLDVRRLEEAAGHFKEAISLARQCGALDREDLAGYLHNFGNLEEVRGDLDAAIAAFDEGASVARAIIGPTSAGTQEKLLSRLLSRAGAIRCRRARGTDREDGIAQLLEVVAMGHPQTIDTAHLALADFLAGEVGDRREEAIAHARRARFDRLPEQHRQRWVDIHVRLGLRVDALRALHQEQARIMEERQHVLADHTADILAAEAQRAAHRAARLEVEDGRTVEAFFTLESASGLRFSEAIAVHCDLAQTPLGRALQLEERLIGTVSGRLDMMANLLAFAPRKDQLATLGAVSDENRSRPPLAFAEDARLHRRIFELESAAFKAAVSSPDIPGALRAESRRLAQKSMLLQRELRRIAPETDEPRPWLARLTPPVLQTLLSQHPGHVLLRFSLLDDLLVVGVWLEGGQIAARSCRVPFPVTLLRRLERFRESRKAEDAERIARDLESIDISSAFPEERMPHAVLLPSAHAVFLPLCALGPHGSTPLDKFDALSWMPCLSPLFERQSPHPPRAGTVVVRPGGTAYDRIAFGARLEAETSLIGANATVPALLGLVPHADVVSFFTHGSLREDLGPVIDLDGQQLTREHLTSGWRGMERVELWACSTGVDTAHDPLTPPVDEGFGLDIEFIRVGVRSTIGTLWKVSDHDTAVLVARYREELVRGRTAPHALANAQRAIRDERRTGAVDVLSDGPFAWCGFRFVGVAERRPDRPWDPAVERDLTPEEQARLDSILASSPPEAVALDDWLEAQLDEAINLKEGESPTPEQAIRVARLYRDRLSSSRVHNLLSALAWLHEARLSIAEQANEKTENWKASENARRNLSEEAAWLWVDLARGERFTTADWILHPPDPVAAARARALVEELPPEPRALPLQAWVDVVSSRVGSATAFEGIVRAAWERAAPALDAGLPDGFAGTRARTAVCELALLLGGIDKGPARRCVDQIRDLSQPRELGEVPSAARLTSALALLSRVAQSEPLSFSPQGALTSFEEAREGLEAWVELWRAPIHEQPQRLQVANRYLDQVEAMFWGYPDDDRVALWRSSGTPGAAYRRVLATWMGRLATAPGHGAMAFQALASACAAADLRLVAASRWAVACGLGGDPPGGRMGQLGLFVRDRETLFERLEAAALLPDVEALEEEGIASQQRPSRLDPFERSVVEVQKTTSNADLVPWLLGRCCVDPPEAPAHVRTAAFAAVRKAEHLTREIARLWDALRESFAERIVSNLDGQTPSLSAMVDPGVRLAAREDVLRQAPSGGIVLGMAVDVAGRLVLAASIGEGGRNQRLLRTEGPVGAQVLGELSRVLAAGLLPPEEARSPRERAWDQIRTAMAAPLEELLGPLLESGPLRLAVIAPGGLRSLPLSGLLIGDRPLADHLAGTLHLPLISMEPGREGGTREACLFGGDPATGATSFGEAAVETLRRWFEPTVLRPPRGPTTDIPEAGQLEAVALQLARLRIYGAERPVTFHHVLAGVDVGRGRMLREQNLRGTFLPRCELVEIWADTAGGGSARDAVADDRDRIPGLVRSFLFSGAAQVIDLAWPIPDVVKALLCERFGMLRHARKGLPMVDLHGAMQEVRDALQGLRGAAGDLRSSQEALAWLDERRKERASELGLDARHVVPFASRAAALSDEQREVSALVEELCAPIHLAGLRCWGWL